MQIIILHIQDKQYRYKCIIVQDARDVTKCTVLTPKCTKIAEC